jgi:hypothetical protein
MSTVTRALSTRPTSHLTGYLQCLHIVAKGPSSSLALHTRIFCPDRFNRGLSLDGHCNKPTMRCRRQMGMASFPHSLHTLLDRQLTDRLKLCSILPTRPSVSLALHSRVTWPDLLHRGLSLDGSRDKPTTRCRRQPGTMSTIPRVLRTRPSSLVTDHLESFSILRKSFPSLLALHTPLPCPDGFNRGLNVQASMYRLHSRDSPSLRVPPTEYPSGVSPLPATHPRTPPTHRPNTSKAENSSDHHPIKPGMALKVCSVLAIRGGVKTETTVRMLEVGT